MPQKRTFRSKGLPYTLGGQGSSLPRALRRGGGLASGWAASSSFKPSALELPSFVRRLVDEILSVTGRRCPVEALLSGVPAEIQADEMHASMKKVLVIEDQAEMRRNLTTILRMERFQPLSAENGREGVRLAKQEKPDFAAVKALYNSRWPRLGRTRHARPSVPRRDVPQQGLAHAP